MADLDQLRSALRAKRQSLSAHQQHAASLQLAEQVASHAAFQNADAIAGYLAVNGEIDPMPLMLQAIAQNKQCLVPVLHPSSEGRLLFAPWTPEVASKPNRFGIQEPQVSKQAYIPAEQIDLVLVPLLGFDKTCNRLGMGGGFYDRTFAFRQQASSHTKPVLLGIAHDCQLVSRLAAQQWDVAMHAIATPSNIYVPTAKAGLTCT